jgi:hypothetical protein
MGKTFLLLATTIELDLWTVADDFFLTSWVIITTTGGDEAGQQLYEMPLMYQVQVGPQKCDVPKYVVAVEGGGSASRGVGCDGEDGGCLLTAVG